MVRQLVGRLARCPALLPLIPCLLAGWSAPAMGGTGPQIVDIAPPASAGVVDQNGLGSVRLTMSEPVDAAPGSVVAWGVAGGPLSLTTSWDEASLVLTVTFALPVHSDRVTLLVGPGVTNLLGEPLDGEVPSPLTAVLPTGDGDPGGIAAFRFDVLQGDVNRDGTTDAADMPLLLEALGSCALQTPEDLNFNSDADLNNDGCVNVLDVQILLSGLGESLPPLDGLPPSIATIGRDPGEPLTEDLAELHIEFTEPIEALGVLPTSVRLRALDGTIETPVLTTLLSDQRTLVTHFDPPLSACGDYNLLLGPSIVDLSGECLVLPEASPGFTGSTPPAPPVVNPVKRSTSAPGVTLTGTLPQRSGFADAVEVRVQGIDSAVTVAASGSFSVTVALKANHVNLLYVSAISACGVTSAPVAIEVARDNEPPLLTVQDPQDGLVTFDEQIALSGYVGDALTGFEGITVMANGVPANVDIGTGELGTWVVPAFALAAGLPTQIDVVATDAVGNVTNRSVTVTREALPRNAASIELVTGNAQVGLVNAPLRTPLRVRVWGPGRTPLANKVVTFRVTRSDGRLEALPGLLASTPDPLTLQTMTDRSGEASVVWTLGSSSGSGNNRVEASAEGVAGLVAFSASASAADADQINIGTGDGQRIEVGGVAPLPLSAWVSDSRNPVAGVPVTFTVVGGNGTVNGASEATVQSGATGHAEVTFTAGTTPGTNRVRATFPGNATSPAVFTVYGIARDITKPTSFSGLVFDNASQPIGNVKLTLKFQDQLVGPVLSNAQGQFAFPSIEHDGAVHVMVEGFLANTLNGKPLPPGVKFPSLGYDTVIVPNAENTIGRPILLPPLLPENAQLWDGQSDIELTCAGIAGLKYIVKANSMTLVNGNHPTPGAPVTLSLNQVHHNAVPMPLPDGASPPFDATFYPPGATFDPPVAVEYPNMSALPPGAAVHFLTFNHDTGEFEAMAPGRVSEDGSTIRSEPGTGLTKSGWHGPALPIQISGRCLGRGLCADPISDNDAPPAAVITVSNRCPSRFDYFMVATPTLSTPMHVKIMTADPEAGVLWTIQTAAEFGGTVEPAIGIAKEFDIKPHFGALDRPLDGSTLHSPPVTYTITAIILNRDGTTPVVTAFLKQSWKAVLRQEYLDAKRFGLSAMPIPNPNSVGPSVGSTDFSAAEFNTGNYGSAQENVVAYGHSQKIAQQTYETFDAEMKISSAFRNPRRNRNVAGAASVSNHMYGSAVDMNPLGVPNEDFHQERVRLYRAAILASSVHQQQGAATKVILEHDGSAILPINWLPPTAPETFAGTFLGTTFQLVCDDLENDDELLDTVVSIDKPDIPTAVALFGVLGAGSEPVSYYAHDKDGDGVISSGDALWLLLPPEINAHIPAGTPRTLDEIAKYATHVHAGRPGYLPIGSGLQDGGEGEVVYQPEAPDDQGQPQAGWTFSIGGQTVTTGPAGAFELDNINGLDSWGVDGPGSPIDGVSDEPVRLVGYRAEDGVTTYAYSEPQFVSDEQTLVLGDLTESLTPAPMPVSIGLSADPILEVGSATQATTISNQNDGTTLDVTAASSWTTYRTSNPAIATVDANGIITGVGAGMVFVTAINGSTTSVAQVIVTDQLVTTTIVGVVQQADGTPVPGAVLVTPLGGSAVSQADGTFALTVDVAVETPTLAVTAVATIRGVSHAGVGFASTIVPGGLSDAGVVVVLPGADCDLAWLPAFGGKPGVSGNHTVGVDALITFDDGTGPAIYVGGSFVEAGGLLANNVARWTGSSWQTIGGFNGPVLDFAIFDDGSGRGPELYAGGAFNATDTRAIGNLARWDGNAWVGVGGGVTGASQTITTLTVFDAGNGEELFVGGNFTSAGPTAAMSIASWNGSEWSALGSGVIANVQFNSPGTVRAMVTFDEGQGTALYVGGTFIRAGGLVASHFAKWTGAAWLDMPDFNGSVHALTVAGIGTKNPTLFAGGEFTLAYNPGGDQLMWYIAQWNSGSWKKLGNGMGAPVTALHGHIDGLLYVGGNFEAASGVPASRIARWDGTTWEGVAGGLTGPWWASGPLDMITVERSGGPPELYVGSAMHSAGGAVVNYLAAFDGRSWSGLGSGFDGAISASMVFDDGAGGGPALYIGGSFTRLGDQALPYIARWDGRSWSSPGGGRSEPVYALTLYDDGAGGGSQLYVAGAADCSLHNCPATVSRWDGQVWTELPGSLDYGHIYAIKPYVDGLHVSGPNTPSLYAAGTFFYVGGEVCQGVARWDGIAWHGVGGGIWYCVQPSADSVGCEASFEGNDLEVFDDGSGEALYIGGRINGAGRVLAQHIARWDGQEWSAVGAGVPLRVTDLATFDPGFGTGPSLFAGSEAGLFSWDGVAWSSPQGGVLGSVETLQVAFGTPAPGPQLLVGGGFTQAGGQPANGLARWNGAMWSPLIPDAAGLAGLPLSISTWTWPGEATPRLVITGSFVGSELGDSYIASLGCPSGAPDAPQARQIVAPRRPFATKRIASASSSAQPKDLTLRTGEELVLGPETRRFGTLYAAAGSTIRLGDVGARLIVTNLFVEDGVRFEWLAGRIEIDGGAWVHSMHLDIGCGDDARLVLTGGGTLQAPQVNLCARGAILGDGLVDAAVQNGGAIASWEDGASLRLTGPYRHELGGRLGATTLPCEGDGDARRIVDISGQRVHVLWRRNEDPALAGPSVCSAEGAWAITIADLDHDGVMDITLTSASGECVVFGNGEVEVSR